MQTHIWHNRRLTPPQQLCWLYCCFDFGDDRLGVSRLLLASIRARPHTLWWAPACFKVTCTCPLVCLLFPNNSKLQAGRKSLTSLAFLLQISVFTMWINLKGQNISQPQNPTSQALIRTSTGSQTKKPLFKLMKVEKCHIHGFSSN